MKTSCRHSTTGHSGVPFTKHKGFVLLGKKKYFSLLFLLILTPNMKHKIALQKQAQMVFVFNFIYTAQVIPYKYQVKHNWF